MKKEFFTAGIIFFAILFALAIFFIYNQKSPDLLSVSDTEIISLLKKNTDANDFIDAVPNFSIKSKTVLTKENILSGRSAKNFKEVYFDLNQENNRYMRVDLTNPDGSRGMITVIDFKNKKVLKAFGLILLKTNGQTSSSPENK